MNSDSLWYLAWTILHSSIALIQVQEKVTESLF